jgi:tRNA(Ile)-lysidine synthase
MSKHKDPKITDTAFARMMAALPVADLGAGDVAVAVSGGGDSMALLYLLSRYMAGRNLGPGASCGKGLSDQVRKPITLHALTVDHGLRVESGREAKQVATWVKELSSRAKRSGDPGPSSVHRPQKVPARAPVGLGRDDTSIITHKTLTWRGAKPKTRIAETARAKRYELMAEYCRKHAIRHLFVAHTLDDQAETFLLRLSAGSGVDGLACMRGVDVLSPPCPPLTGEDKRRRGRDDILVMRPLLSVTHDQLLATLRAAGQGWIEDPTNQNPAYARPRLRAARDVLVREGLTPERLAGTAARMARARDTIAWAVDYAWQVVVESQGADRLLPLKGGGQGGGEVRIDRTVFDTWPDDIQMRVLMRAVVSVGRKVPRLEQIEALWADMQVAAPVRTWRRTLAGAVITRGAKIVKITLEKGSS